jgi:ABC-type multidrug transport system ATPase subunit
MPAVSSESPQPTAEHKQLMPTEALMNQRSVRVDFKDVVLDVAVKGPKLCSKSDGATKRILTNVTGFALPGEVLFIMGPSGAGKTTLLDCLAGRTKQLPKGGIFLNSVPKTDDLLKVYSKYCTQEIQLYEAMTVRETLQSAAGFYAADSKDVEARVDEAVAMLGLHEQEHTKIGGIFFRGCSGGQKRRVAIGEQVVAQSSVLFLDEPTSGLDSAAAYQLVLKLRDIAQSKRVTIICSIHQPSERVFELSDRLLLLAGGKSGGHTAYFGPSSQAGTYFQSNCGLTKPEDTSVAEWLLDEVNGDFGDEEKIQEIVKAWETSEKLESLVLEVDAACNDESLVLQEAGVTSGLSIGILIKRGVRNMIRNPAVLWLRFAMYIALSFMIGTVWWQIGDSPIAGDIPNIAGVEFFIAAFMVRNPLNPAQ